MTDLFTSDLVGSAGGTGHVLAPLAVRMRPQRLDEVVGQDHALRPGAPMRVLVESLQGPASQSNIGPTSVVLWGPPGTGKTTLARLLSSASGANFVQLSALTAGVKDVREVLKNAAVQRDLHRRRTVLFLDEIHRFSKSQQDALLAGVEDGTVILVAATTENPSFSVVAPLLSRSVLVTLKSLDDSAIQAVIERALHSERGLQGHVTLTSEALEHLVRVASGDARRALTCLEAAVASSVARGDGVAVTEADAVEVTDVALVRYDKDGDQHYDVVSAFIKSIRGSDVDAALHYLARMLEAGEDVRFIARRLIISASEDIGMADPSALQTAVAAAQAVQLIGMPEGRIVLAQAVVHLATAPKSNRAYLGIDAAIADVRAGKSGQVPHHLRDAHYPGAKQLGHGKDYRYAHDEPHGIASQRHLPDTLQDSQYYKPADRGYEAQVAARLERIRGILAGETLRSRG